MKNKNRTTYSYPVGFTVVDSDGEREFAIRKDNQMLWYGQESPGDIAHNKIAVMRDQYFDEGIELEKAIYTLLGGIFDNDETRQKFTKAFSWQNRFNGYGHFNW
jgi:hypothetical protein